MPSSLWVLPSPMNVHFSHGYTAGQRHTHPEHVLVQEKQKTLLFQGRKGNGEREGVLGRERRRGVREGQIEEGGTHEKRECLLAFYKVKKNNLTRN